MSENAGLLAEQLSTLFHLLWVSLFVYLFLLALTILQTKPIVKTLLKQNRKEKHKNDNCLWYFFMLLFSV